MRWFRRRQYAVSSQPLLRRTRRGNRPFGPWHSIHALPEIRALVERPWAEVVTVRDGDGLVHQYREGGTDEQ